MTWILWILLSNTAIMWLEWIYRSAQYTSFWSALPYTIVPIFVGQFGLFYGFKFAPSLLIAGTTFAIVNASLRMVNTKILGETIVVYTWVGLMFLVAASILFKLK